MASRLDSIVHGDNLKEIPMVESQFTLEEKSSDIDEEDLRREQTVYTWLKPVDMENEQYHFKHIRKRCSPGPTPGRWLLEHMTFKEWFDPQFTTLPTLLWLHGHPGAGKCTLTDHIVLCAPVC